MPATLTTMDKLLKLVYLPRIRGQFYKETPAFSRLKKKGERHHFSGRNAVVPVKYRRSESVGARVENAALPTAQNQRFENLTIPCRYIYGKVKLTGQTISMADGDKGSFASALNDEMEGIKESMMFDIARQVVYGDGTGKLAQCNGAGAATATLVVDNPGVDHLREGMVIDIYTGAGSQEVNSIEITAVDRATNTVTLASAQSWTDNSFVYREDARNAEMMGLGGIVDDGSNVGTFQGLARSSNTWLKSNVLSNPLGAGTNRPLTVRLVDDLCLEAAKRGPGGKPTVLLSKHTIAQDYADLVRADRRYSPREMMIDGGWEGIEVTSPAGKVPWAMDRMVRANKVYAVDEKALMWFEAEAPGWMDRDGKVLTKALDGTDAYEATLFTYAEMAAGQCNTSTILADITEN